MFKKIMQFIDTYGVYLGVGVLLATALMVVVTHSDPYLSTWLVALGFAAGFLFKRNNPDLWSKW